MKAGTFLNGWELDDRWTVFSIAFISN